LCDPAARTSQRGIFVDRLLHKRAPFSHSPLKHSGRAQAHQDILHPGPVAGGMTEGQARLQHPDGVLQVPLGEV
jgi:hypothetical protein